MTSDMGEMFNAYRKDRQAKRERNREYSAKILLEAGISFESKNGGAHLIVEGKYDFWPGTGLWRSRLSQAKGRGVTKLIARLRAGG